MAGDPRGYVMAALTDPRVAMLTAAGLEASHVNFATFQEARMAEQLARELKKPAAAEVKSGTPGPGVPPQTAPPQAMADAAPQGITAPPAAGQPAASPPPGPPQQAAVRREVFQDKSAARVSHAASTDAPFVERLVQFWSNHFCISASKGPGVRIMAGGFEREAIRPHVLGRFGDMLKAVEQHPAMLIYLDNAQSIGPNSQAGRNRGRGLNENLAREILELHTLGVDGGYTQADVTSLARIITGWTIVDQRFAAAQPKGRPAQNLTVGTFMFAQPRHEPGQQTVLGKVYADNGLATGEEALADLARHPATARHIARKLAQHFVSETPPPALVARLEKTFRDTDGNLGAVAKALASAPEHGPSHRARSCRPTISRSR